MKTSRAKALTVLIAVAVIVSVSRCESGAGQHDSGQHDAVPQVTPENAGSVASNPELGEGSSAKVIRVVDGDTVYTSDGGKVRVIGYDTPEHGECGFDEAKEFVTDFAMGRTVTLINPTSVDDEDRYERWLRYVEVDGQDLGFAVIEAGLAHARYDGLDGYDSHPLQDAYRTADSETPHLCG